MNLIFKCLTILSVYALDRPNGVASFNYCKIKCGGKDKHTMCKWPTNEVDFSGACKKSKVRVGLLSDLKKALVHSHNVLRQAVAQGWHLGGLTGLGDRVQEQPKASNMMRLKWHNEAAEIAQHWANQCRGGHDVCRKLKDTQYLGQNGFSSSGIPDDRTELANSTIRAFSQEVQYFPTEAVDKFDLVKDVIGKVGHYTQLVWAKSTAVGCGSIEYVKGKGKKGVTIVCNYIRGNMGGTPIYIRGEPCSKCPEGGKCSTKYPGLCLNAGDDDNDGNIKDDKIIETTERKQNENKKPKPKDETEDENEDKNEDRQESEGGRARSSKASRFITVCILLFGLFLWF